MKKELKCGSLNVKAGLIKREVEIRELIKKYEIDVLFLNEADTHAIKKESDFRIEGFETVIWANQKLSSLLI